MARVASKGITWSGRLRVSDCPVLRKWMELEAERWHEVQVGQRPA